MRRRKRGRELVRVAFQAQAVGRSPSFSLCGHFWRHLLVTKGGKSAPRRKRRIEGRDASRRIDRKIFLLSKFFFCAFGLIQKHQKIKHREKQRVRAPALAERSRKIYAVCARSLRALAPLPSLLPLFSQCDPADRRSAKIQFRKIRSSVKTRRAAARSRPMRRAASSRHRRPTHPPPAAD